MGGMVATHLVHGPPMMAAQPQQPAYGMPYPPMPAPGVDGCGYGGVSGRKEGGGYCTRPALRGNIATCWFKCSSQTAIACLDDKVEPYFRDLWAWCDAV
jgi:hypothetical protein